MAAVSQRDLLRPCQSVREFGDAWLEWRGPGLAKTTRLRYRRTLALYVYPSLGDRLLESLNYLDFDDLAQELRRRSLGAGSIGSILVVARSMLSDAVRCRLIPSNPAVGVHAPSRPPSIGVDIPDAHLCWIRQALVDRAPADPYRPGLSDMLGPLAFDLALGSGLRWSELIALRWSRCEFSARVIHVEEARVLGELKAPKSGKGRAIPMFPTAHEALRRLAERALYHGRRAPEEFALTSTVRRQPLDKTSWGTMVWRPALATAGLSEHRYRWMDLRHTCLSRLAAQGADPALIRIVAGHSYAATTLRIYTHVRAERITDAAHHYDPGTLPSPQTPATNRPTTPHPGRLDNHR